MVGDGNESLRDYLRRKGLEVCHANQMDTAPEGKRIAKIIVVPLDVIQPEDAFPRLVNWFHVTTKPEIVERELLFASGDSWKQSQIDETAHNLRTNLFVNAVDITPYKGDKPDELVAVVVVKDLWSLRTQWSYQIVGSTLQSLDLELGEFNLFGRKQKAALNFALDPSTVLWGQDFEEPRVLGSRILFREEADVILNRQSGSQEGALINFDVEKPLFSLDTEWGWGITGNYRKDIYRLLSNFQPVMVTSPTTGEAVPYDYRRETLEMRASITHSTGHDIKRDYSFGWRGVMRNFGLYESAPTYQQASLNDFAANYLPRTENSSQLFVGFHLWRPDYVKTTNIDVFGIEEELRAGPDLQFEERVASQLLSFGTGGNFLESVAHLAHTWVTPSDDYFTAGATGQIRYQPEAGLDSPWINRRAMLYVRNVSPRWGWFRLITSARLTRRDRDLDRTLDTLGGDGALRGFPSAYLYGPQSWGANAEVRTKPFVFKSLYAGGAAFLDLGDATFSTAFNTHAAAGFGLRLMFPQFARSVMRLDFSFPLDSTLVGAQPSYFSAQLGQAFF